MQILNLILVVEYLLPPKVVHAGVFSVEPFDVIFLFFLFLAHHRLVALDQIEQLDLVLPFPFEHFCLQLFDVLVFLGNLLSVLGLALQSFFENSLHFLVFESEKLLRVLQFIGILFGFLL